MKFRIIPTILTDGITVVKGTNFNNWRTVGSAEATARLFAARDVDELIFLDVTARQRNTTIQVDLIEKFSNLLSIPFAVGGGVDTLEQASMCFRAGAEKVILGSAAYRNPALIKEIADVFGSQAIVVTVDMATCASSNFLVESGKKIIEEDFIQYIKELEMNGAGEIILQCKESEGHMKGLCLDHLSQAVTEVKCPILVSGGAQSASDFISAFKLGAAGVAAGAIFQFTEHTPNEIRKEIKSSGVPVRNI